MATKTTQFNVQVREDQKELLLHYAVKTKSIARNGPTKGEPSIGALIRRISEGKVAIVFEGERIAIPPNFLLNISANSGRSQSVSVRRQSIRV